MSPSSSTSSENPAIEFYVIGGYLGAGKTTLLNNILRQPGLANTAVLVNDFGKINIDAELIENTDGETYRLENGCICCNIGQAFFTTLLRVVNSEPRPRRILVEASGVADPARIADIARLSPSMELRRVAVVVDCSSVRVQVTDPQIDTMVMRQLESADTLLLNKRDLIDAADYKLLADWIARINPDATIIPCEQARTDIADILVPAALLTDASGPLTDLAQASFNDVADRHALIDWTVELPPVVNESALTEALKALPASVHRVKGFACVNETDGWRLVQYTPGQVELSETSGKAGELSCRLVFIGTELNPSAIDFLHLLRAEFAESLQRG